MGHGALRLAAVILVAAVLGWFWTTRKHPVASPFPRPMRLPEESRQPSAAMVPTNQPPPAETAVHPTAKVAVLNEILASGNDNDPRLDSDFRNLDAQTKAALVGYYKGLPAEDYNGRGTVVFLLGREIQSESDLAFFDEVMKENIPPAPKQAHGALPQELLVAYPQVMAVSALKATRSRAADENLRQAVTTRLATASQSPNRQVAQRAARALR